MSETQPRRRAAATKEQQFHWFKGESVRELYDQIGAAGPDSARVEVRQQGEHMTFRVVADGEGAEDGKAAMADINNSFLCPPRCP